MSRQHNIIFLDLDDVCCDWSGEAQRVLGITIDRGGLMLNQNDWARLCSYERFYRDLPLLDGALELVEWATEYARTHSMGLSFLTAIPEDGSVPHCMSDKETWVNRYFPHVPVTFGPYPKDKHRHHCKKGDILIDDRVDNCQLWSSVGGIAHVYSTWENCQIWINTELPKHSHNWR